MIGPTRIAWESDHWSVEWVEDHGEITVAASRADRDLLAALEAALDWADKSAAAWTPERPHVEIEEPSLPETGWTEVSPYARPTQGA